MKLNGVDIVNSNKKPYYGSARFVEISPPGIPYRASLNVDHITSVMFGEKREDVPAPIPEGEEPPESVLMENQVTGFTVSIGVAGSKSDFTFIEIEIAMMFYNDVVSSIHSLVPCSLLQPMQVPPPPLSDPMLGDMSDEEIDALDSLDGDDLPGDVDLDDDESTPDVH